MTADAALASKNTHAPGPACAPTAEEEDLTARMTALGQAAREAAAALAVATPEAKTHALRAAAAAIRDTREEILKANAADMAAARTKGLSRAMLDRLALTPERIEA
ncbi:MAG: gamma-glutamyl-phosphate reductase, partial [Alphaproteobacteria bacterium]